MECCGSRKAAPETHHGPSEELLRIPGAVVHLVDGEQSVHLATGDFSLDRLTEDGKGIAVLGKVGDLQWPLVKDGPAGKLYDRHYFFSLKIPDAVDEGIGVEHEEKNDHPPNLTYGLTFTDPNTDPQLLAELDNLLPYYSLFSVPSAVRGPGENPPPSEASSAAYWTILAPNVEEYNTRIAKGIAVGTGRVIQGILWCSDVTIEQLEKGCLYMKGHIKAGEKPLNIGATTLKNLHRVRKLTGMTEQLAKTALAWIVKTTGIISGSLMKSRAGQQVCRWLPGEVALVSLDAFGSVLDALEVAGTEVLYSTHSATSGMVAHRFGEKAGTAADDTLASAGHVFGTVWVFTKLRRALNPKSGSKTMTKTGLIKSAGKAALKRVKK